MRTNSVSICGIVQFFKIQPCNCKKCSIYWIRKLMFSITSLRIAARYPFFGPDNCTTEQQERSVQNTDDKETKTASSNDLNCSVTDLYISLLTSRQRKLRKKEHERYQQNKTTNERETLSHGGSVWLTHDELVKEKYRSSLNFQ